MKRLFKFIGRIRSFKYALKGIFTMLASQHNARIHAEATILVIVTGWWLGITRAEWLWVVLAVMAVWSAEAMLSGLSSGDSGCSNSNYDAVHAIEVGIGIVFGIDLPVSV